jgi:hypothetical protein
VISKEHVYQIRSRIRRTIIKRVGAHAPWPAPLKPPDVQEGTIGMGAQCKIIAIGPTITTVLFNATPIAAKTKCSAGVEWVRIIVKSLEPVCHRNSSLTQQDKLAGVTVHSRAALTRKCAQGVWMQTVALWATLACIVALILTLATPLAQRHARTTKCTARVVLMTGVAKSLDSVCHRNSNLKQQDKLAGVTVHSRAALMRKCAQGVWMQTVALWATLVCIADRLVMTLASRFAPCIAQPAKCIAGVVWMKTVAKSQAPVCQWNSKLRQNKLAMDTVHSSAVNTRLSAEVDKITMVVRCQICACRSMVNAMLFVTRTVKWAKCGVGVGMIEGDVRSQTHVCPWRLAWKSAPRC